MSEENPSVTNSSQQQQQQTEFNISDSVKNYLIQLQKLISTGHPSIELQQYLEVSFLKLSDRHFKSYPWPSPSSLESLIGTTTPEQFPLIYSELYFRHIYARLNPTIQQRIDSWNNYSALFDWLEKPSHSLPEQYSWDIVDEFVYQFQSFCAFRSKLKNKSLEEIEQLKNAGEAWSSVKVIERLERLSKLGHGPLSFFAIISLVRIRCMFGEYEEALKTLDGWDLNSKSLSVVAAQLSLSYYIGFAYLISRRYIDAVRTFSKALLSISRAELQPRTYQFEQTNKKLEQMTNLLAIASVLGRIRIDESLRLVVREKLTESKLNRLQRGDVSLFDELFCFSCPKFFSPNPPALTSDPSVNYINDLLKVQLKKIQDQAELHARLENVRSLLKLYTSIPIPKIARFLELDELNVRETLNLIKENNRQLVWKSGSLASGEVIESVDIDFTIENDLVGTKDLSVSPTHCDYFRTAISRLEEVIQSTQRSK